MLILVAVVFSSNAVSAHIGEHGEVEVKIVKMQALKNKPNWLRIDVSINNSRAKAVTLRAVKSKLADQVNLIRIKTLFGKQHRQAVRFVRIGAKQHLDLSAPNYRLEIKLPAHLQQSLQLIDLEFDFGAAGSITVHEVYNAQTQAIAYAY